jgi:[protein-PII] uridylyltransferase
MLSMLYLLTYADIRSIGPGVWSDWKGGLLEELYRNTSVCLGRNRKTPASRRREDIRIKKSVERQLGDGFDSASIENFIQALPERYLLSMEADAIAAHMMMAGELDEISMSTFCRELPERGCTEISIVTRDAPGLFEKITGVLSANGVNVLDAQFYTNARGEAVDVLWITDATNKPVSDPEVLSNIRVQMSEVVDEKRSLEEIVSAHIRPRILSGSVRKRSNVVTVDNDVSDAETIVEIQTDDRRGLLYTIAACFNGLGLTIDRAMITTQVDRVIDVFYIRERSGGKVESRQRLELIKDRLKESIDI